MLAGPTPSLAPLASGILPLFVKLPRSRAKQKKLFPWANIHLAEHVADFLEKTRRKAWPVCRIVFALVENVQSKSDGEKKGNL